MKEEEIYKQAIRLGQCLCSYIEINEHKGICTDCQGYLDVCDKCYKCFYCWKQHRIKYLKSLKE